MSSAVHGVQLDDLRAVHCIQLDDLRGVNGVQLDAISCTWFTTGCPKIYMTELFMQNIMLVLYLPPPVPTPPKKWQTLVILVITRRNDKKY